MFTMEKAYQCRSQIIQRKKYKVIRVRDTMMGKIEVSHDREREPKRTRRESISAGRVLRWVTCIGTDQSVRREWNAKCGCWKER